MTKADILKDKNIPQFIKDIIEKVSEDADIQICTVKSDRKPTTKEGGCKCGKCEEVYYPDGVDISAYMSSVGDMACSLLSMTDDKARLRKEDIDAALGYIDCMASTLARLGDLLCMNKDK